MFNLSQENLWMFGRKSDKLFLSNSENSNNPFICLLSVIIGCALVVLIIEERQGTQASEDLKDFFYLKIREHVNNDPSFKNFLEADSEIFESMLNQYIEMFKSEDNTISCKVIANTLYLNEEKENSILDELQSFYSFGVKVKAYRTLIIETFFIGDTNP